jgi:hypothetical protein
LISAPVQRDNKLMTTISFLYWEECPSHEAALARLRAVMAEEDVDAPIELVRVDTESDAMRLTFIGSPTIRVNGQDIDPPPAGSICGLTCRAYRRGDGRISPLPPESLIRSALRASRGS